MTASERLLGHAPDPTLSRIHQHSFGDTAWVTLALQNCAEHLKPAIRAGSPHGIANAVRAIAHAPTPEQLADVATVACDTVLAEAYAGRNARLVSKVEAARSIVATVVAEVRERSELDGTVPLHVRESVDAYLRIVGLVDEAAARRLDAVGNLAARIASSMHLPTAAIAEVKLAGRLHDIGALAPCSVEERPIVGETFLKGVPSLAGLAPLVRSHRERYDGQGYPDGLAGEEIPQASRIIGVAAAFVDLVTGSPAQDAVLPATACRKLSLAAGTLYDPRVVAATLQLLRFRQRTNRSA